MTYFIEHIMPPKKSAPSNIPQPPPVNIERPHPMSHSRNYMSFDYEDRDGQESMLSLL